MTGHATKGTAPPWLQGLGAAAWISSRDGQLVHLNRRAERLMGRPASACLGRPCHLAIAASDPWGRPFCAPLCALRRRLAERKALEPVRMCILDADCGEHWVRVLPIALGPSRPGQRLLHCALDDTQTRRMEDYLEHLAARPHGRHERHSLRSPLTPREREILQRLDEAQSLREIALRLDLSYATVRNHVQHLLAKLEAHSIQEAVALDLLGRLR